MRASLVIPTLNEAGSIGPVLTSFRAAAEAANRTVFRDDPLVWELLVVDGASTDRTAEEATAAGARVLIERRPGYGRAYRTGFAEATGEVLATSDGDGTYPVATIPTLVRRLLDERLDFLTGDRMAYLDRKSMTTEHRIGNWVLNEAANFLFHRFVRTLPGGRLRDSQSGFWVFRREVLDRVHLTQDGMPLSEEFKIEALIRGLKFAEVPIRYGERWGVPKLSSWRDGRRNFQFLFRKRFEFRLEERRAGVAVRRKAPDGTPPP